MVVGAATMLLAQTSSAPPPLSLEQAATIFGSRETVLQASLSPDGHLLATVEPLEGRGTVVQVTDLSVPDSKPLPITVSGGDPERVEWCRWSGNRRLLCNLYGLVVLPEGELSYATRLIAMDADGKRLQVIRTPQLSGTALGYSLFGGSVIDWNTGEEGHVLMARRYIPEGGLGTRMVQTADGLGVDDINTGDLKATKLEFARKEALDYISDGLGHVRIMGYEPATTSKGYLSGKVRYVFRTRADANWQPLGDYDGTSNIGFNPYYVDPTLDLVYGLKKVDGRRVAYTVSLDGQRSEKLILAQPNVDVNGFATIGRNRRVIGVTYTTDRSEVRYIDPELEKLAASLARGLKTLPLIRFVDSSQDERKLLLWAGSDVDPGHYYLLDRDTRALTELQRSRLPLANRPLAAVRSVSVKVADGTEVPAYLTLPVGSDGKNLPAIVMPHGGPSARDEWGFDWLAQFWANRGYAVLQPNFRGSAGYGDAWFQDNGFQSWKTAIGDVADSGRWLVNQGIADPKKLAIVGWSYGGYAALQSAAVQPDLFRAVIAIAPVTDLGRLKEEWAGWNTYQLAKDFIGSGPHIDEGSPARQAAQINVPVLMFHGTYDRNVKIGQSQLMAERLRSAGKSGRLVTYEKLDHYLDDSNARKDMLMQSANFLDEAFASGE